MCSPAVVELLSARHVQPACRWTLAGSRGRFLDDRDFAIKYVCCWSSISMMVEAPVAGGPTSASQGLRSKRVTSSFDRSIPEMPMLSSQGANGIERCGAVRRARVTKGNACALCALRTAQQQALLSVVPQPSPSRSMRRCGDLGDSCRECRQRT